jgi:hypothetical protein
VLEDLRTLGFRTRRTPDARRTFVSLSLADGARRDILRWITHGPEGDIMSLYTTLPWTALCEEFAKLNIDLRTGKLSIFDHRKIRNRGRRDRPYTPLLLVVNVPHRAVVLRAQSSAVVAE